MDPIAFEVFNGFEIHWYGVCIAIGFLCSVGLLRLIKKYAHITDDHVYTITMLALIMGIIGARLFYVIQFHHQFPYTTFGEWLYKIINIRAGGIVFYGGFIGGFTSMLIYAKLKHINTLELLDVLSPAMLIAHAFGRIGCFMQGCCHGAPAPEWLPFAPQFPAGSLAARVYPAILDPLGRSVPVYPVQIYEAIGNFCLCALMLWILRKKRIFPGIVIVSYLASYAVLRFLLEFLRGDHTDFFLGMTPAQNIALFLMLPCAAILFFWGRTSAKKAKANPAAAEEEAAPEPPKSEATHE